MVSTKIKCPKCGSDMNLHAQKIVHGVINNAAEPDAEFLNASLQEFHACPNCGAGVSRDIAP